jgi:hypothetical protein
MIYNPKDATKAPTDKDIDYILDKFIDAVEKRGLLCGGGCHQTRLDIITCEYCFKNEALDDCDYCIDCLDKIAKKHGYEPKPPFIRSAKCKTR